MANDCVLRTIPMMHLRQRNGCLLALSTWEQDADTGLMSENPAGTASQGTATGSVLVVDDDEQVRRMLLRILGEGGYEGTAAANGAEARDRLECRQFDAVLIDARMPGESGLDLLRHVRSAHADTAAIMVTASEDQELIEASFTAGAYGYVVKPFRSRDLLINVSSALHRRSLDISNRSHIRDLEATVEERTRMLHQALAKAPDPDAFLVPVDEVIQELSRAVTVRDEETGAHILRMSHYAALLAERAGLTDGHPQRIHLASALHDVGKIGIPDAVLQKPGPLTTDERAVMQRHTVIGHELLSSSESPLLRLGATIALTHHERWDGLGYPNGVAGTDIPAEGRIAAIADVFDALTSDRVYRKAFPVETAIEMMARGRGTQFDPDLLDLFLSLIPEILVLRSQHPDA